MVSRVAIVYSHHRVVAIVGAPEREVLWVGSARSQMADWCMGTATI